MKYINLGKSNLSVSAVAAGCMGYGGGWSENGATFETDKKDEAGFFAAIDNGINLFDVADIYGCGGRSEESLGNLINKTLGLRRKIIVQSKCGIRSGFFDFSKEHIVNSVEASLKRLKTDYLDVLLLHRPDTLVEYEEVAEAFDLLEKSGKVRYFGVSNHSAAQISALQKYISQPIICNQIQFSVVHAGIIDEGIYFNRYEDFGVNYTGGVLEYCRENNITIQAYNSIAGGCFCGDNVSGEYSELSKKIKDIAKERGVTEETVAFAWVLRHPANIQPVVGSRTPERIKSAATASQIRLTREEWYGMYFSVKGKKQP